MAEEIVPDIKWTDSAKITYHKIIEYLQRQWSDRDVETFVIKVNDMLATLKRYPEMCRPSLKRKNVRIGIVDKHTQIIYHYKPRKKQIIVLLFWGMKQNPAKFRY